jgi:hypothetical protein
VLGGDRVVVVVGVVVTLTMDSTSRVEEVVAAPKHVVMVGQKTELTLSTLGGRVCELHRSPPSMVATRSSGAAPLLLLPPMKPTPELAQQSKTLGQEMLVRPPTLFGTPWSTHVIPLSVVIRICAVANPSPKPAAKQVLGPGHERAKSGPVSTGSDWLVHLRPPSVVARIRPSYPIRPPPAARQSEFDVHATASSGPVPSGRCCDVQVLPPSVVATTMPVAAKDALEAAMSAPTAQQTVVDLQVSASKSPVLGGRLWATHVAPPSVVATTTPVPVNPVEVVVTFAPTAQQVDVVTHAIALSDSTPAGTGCLLQVLQPSAVASTIGVPVPVEAIARQSVAVGHVIADKLLRPPGTTSRGFQVLPPSVVVRTTSAAPKSACLTVTLPWIAVLAASAASVPARSAGLPSTPPTPPPPTTVQSKFEPHATATRLEVPVGRVWFAHEFPASAVATTAPSPPRSLPTAQHRVVDGHAIPPR